MHRIRLAAAALAAAVAVAASAPAVAEEPLEQTLKALIQARADAFGSADGEGYKRLLAETEEADYSYVNEAGVFQNAPDDGSDWFPQAVEAHPSSTVHSLSLQRYGDTVVATYTLDVRLTFNRETIIKTFRTTEVFHRSGGKWRSVARHESVPPGEPHWAAEIDPAVLDDYVGSYNLLPGVDYRIVRRGDKLFWGEGADGAEMVPESSATFATGPSGLGYRLIFLRDHDGKVTGMRIREFSGVEYTAVRNP